MNSATCLCLNTGRASASVVPPPGRTRWLLSTFVWFPLLRDENQVERGELVRDGLFSAASRTYAEQYIEPLIRQKFNLLEPSGDDYDAGDREGQRYEIKASKVMRRRNNRKDSKTIMARILYEVEDSPLHRYFDSSERLNEDYDANIQNVKRDHFDTLIYVLLFKDCLRIFFANVSTIASGLLPNWSDKHGRYDQEGKSGQFPISKSNIEWHESQNLEYVMTYEEAAQIFQRL
jgi:hypothetical protein